MSKDNCIPEDVAVMENYALCAMLFATHGFGSPLLPSSVSQECTMRSAPGALRR